MRVFVRGMLLGLLLARVAGAQVVGPERAAEEHLTFQTSGPWSPAVNVNADVVLAYGITPSLPQRIQSWREHGYRVQVMLGIAWGDYQEFLDGKMDGKDHWDETQTRADGSQRLHGPRVPYIAPEKAFGDYLAKEIVERGLEAGAEGVVLEEPEFWADAGWSKAFQREWESYYHGPWQSPDSSPEAQYRASALKYFLYRRTIEQVVAVVKAYAAEKHKEIPCYIATHSLLNYASWQIVSPESSLLKTDVDGYIGQIWTGTARVPNNFNGVQAERPFETAFLEYGAIQNLVRASGRKVWYLNDPIEDNPNHSWTDYRFNWENTLTASLLQPEVWRYEILPWPDRIFPATARNRHLVEEKGTERTNIPKDYESELETVFAAMGAMKQPAAKLKWEQRGTAGIGILASDSMLFQRAKPSPSDAQLGSFYGLALPLLERGLPVGPVQMENATGPGTAGSLGPYKVLLLTYEGQKPPSVEFHRALAAWVRAGGELLIVDDQKDPYNTVRAWWDAERRQLPLQDLFHVLGVTPKAGVLQRVGAGSVMWQQVSPAGLSHSADGAERVLAWTKQAAAQAKLTWKESHALVLRRGPYLVAAGLSDGAAPLRGRFLDLFDAKLDEVSEVSLATGQRHLLLDLDAETGAAPRVIAGSARIRKESFAGDTLTLEADGFGDSDTVLSIRTTRKAAEATVDGKVLDASAMTVGARTVRIRYASNAAVQQVQVRFRAR